MFYVSCLLHIAYILQSAHATEGFGVLIPRLPTFACLCFPHTWNLRSTAGICVRFFMSALTCVCALRVPSGRVGRCDACVRLWKGMVYCLWLRPCLWLRWTAWKGYNGHRIRVSPCIFSKMAMQKTGSYFYFLKAVCRKLSFEHCSINGRNTKLLGIICTKTNARAIQTCSRSNHFGLCLPK